MPTPTRYAGPKRTGVICESADSLDIRSQQLGRDDREGRDRNGDVDADRPFEHVDVGLEYADVRFGREFALTVADGSGKCFGLGTVEPRGFEVAGGAERVEGGPVHG